MDYKKQPLFSLHFTRTSPRLVSAPQTEARTLFLSLFGAAEGEQAEQKLIGRFPALKATKCPLSPGLSPPAPPGVPEGGESGT